MDHRSVAGRPARPAAVLLRRFLYQSREPDPDRGDLRAQPQSPGGLWRHDLARPRLLSRRRRLYFGAADEPVRLRPWPGGDDLDFRYHRDGGLLRRYRAARHRPRLSHDHAGAVAGTLGARLPDVRRHQWRQWSSRSDPTDAVRPFARERRVVLLVRADRGRVRLADDGDLRVVVVRIIVEGRARPAAPDGGARLQSLADPLDHIHLRRLLGRR